MQHAAARRSWGSKHAAAAAETPASSEREEFGGEQCREGGQGQKPEKLVLHRRRLEEKTIADKRGGERSQPWKFLEA